MKKLVLKLLVFVAILASLLVYFDSFFIENDNSSVSSYRTVYEEEKESVSLVFLGNSHQGKGLDTNIINAKCETNSIKINGGGINIAQIYYNLLETLKYQSPQIVAIETWALIDKGVRYNKIIDSSGNLMASPYKMEYNKRFGKAKYKEIASIYPKSKLFHMFNAFRFHENWQDTEKWSKSLYSKFTYSASERSLDKKINWHLSFDRVKKYNEKTFSTEGMELTAYEEKYINKIIDLSNSNGFKILFYSVPVYRPFYNKTKEGFDVVHKEIKRISKNHKNVDFFDLNSLTTGFDYTCMMNEKVSDNQHVNYKGQIKTSALLANYLNNNYSLELKGVFQNNFLNTPENLIYNTDKVKQEEDFIGSVNKINGQFYNDIKGDKVITIPKHIMTINLEGWMHKNDISSSIGDKIVAFKKNNNFVYVVREDQLRERKAPMLVKKYGEDFENGGYELKLSKKLLETGSYSIFHIIRDKNKKYHMKNTYKRIIIE
ncbi:hypothetical protein [Winogradskyella vidalii]|uniref:hypothetical protein n=1 Tax=Winogradskyella vidalii TaxID=2615024 RepID=UPI0015C9B351|nr:hypothetical protein [Winogradskyella vidalii]